MSKKIEFDIEPFGLKNDVKILGMDSALQCMLSLQNLIQSINHLSNQQQKSVLVKKFYDFIQSSHDSQCIKDYFGTNDQTNIFQDPYEFTSAFIKALEKELKSAIKGLFTGEICEMQECSNGKCKSTTESEKPFSMIELSYKQALRILYIPYDLQKIPILISKTSDIKGDFIVICENHNKFSIIEDSYNNPIYSNIYAFELPKLKKDSKFAIIQLISKVGSPIATPFLCEVSLKKSKDIKDIISDRIDNDSIEIELENDDIEFTNYNIKSKSLNICLQSIKVTVSNNDQNKFKREPEVVEEEETYCDLQSMFNSYISISKLDNKETCKKCKSTNYPYCRKKLTKLPKILIFQLIKSKDRDRNHEQIKIPEYFTLDTGDYNKFNVANNRENEGKVPKYELRAVSHQFKLKKDMVTYSEVKRGNEWYYIKDTEVRKKTFSDDYSNTAYMLFYEMIINDKDKDSEEEKDGDGVEETHQTSPKNPNKQIVNYNYNGKKSIVVDKNDIENADEFIGLIRKKCKNDEILGFKYNGRSYFDEDETPITDILPQDKSIHPTIEIILKEEEEEEKKPAPKPKPKVAPKVTPKVTPFAPKAPSKPAGPSGRPSSRPALSKMPSSSSKCFSLAIIDYSSSMIACFKNTGLRRAKIAVETVNRFLKAGQLYCNEDSFKLAKLMSEIDQAKYEPNLFKMPSDLQTSLSSIRYIMKKKTEFQYKRILLVTDGVFIQQNNKKEEEEEVGDDDDDESFNGIFRYLIENQIILDVVLLKYDSQMAKDLCAISHLSGGFYCCPESLNDLYSFIEDEKIVDLHQRRLLRPSSFNEAIFKKISEKISLMTKRKTNKYTGFYKEDIILGLPSREYAELEDIDNENQSRIEKEIDICAYLQKGKKQAFAVYRVQNQNYEIDKKKIVLFLKTKNNVVLQFYVFFPESYPAESPVFRLISQVDMTNDKIPNYNFKVQEDEYSEETHLKDLINELNELLQSPEVEEDLNGVKSPIESFDQIDCKFHINYGEGDKNLDYAKKFAK